MVFKGDVRWRVGWGYVDELQLLLSNIIIITYDVRVYCLGLRQQVPPRSAHRQFCVGQVRQRPSLKSKNSYTAGPQSRRPQSHHLQINPRSQQFEPQLQRFHCQPAAGSVAILLHCPRTVQ